MEGRLGESVSGAVEEEASVMTCMVVPLLVWCSDALYNIVYV